MNIASIPTKYKGINFRSRLEARWAAFFDLLGFDWEYEPTDFNGWIPDFRLKGHKNLYVEVKPFDMSSAYDGDDDLVESYLWARKKYGSVNDVPMLDREWKRCLDKIVNAKIDANFLILGDGIYKHYKSKNDEYSLGVLVEESKEEDEVFYYTSMVSVTWGSPYAIHTTSEPNYLPSEMLYGVKKGGYVASTLPNCPLNIVEGYWNEAGNRTQWKGSK